VYFLRATLRCLASANAEDKWVMCDDRANKYLWMFWTTFKRYRMASITCAYHRRAPVPSFLILTVIKLYSWHFDKKRIADHLFAFIISRMRLIALFIRKETKSTNFLCFITEKNTRLVTLFTESRLAIKLFYMPIMRRDKISLYRRYRIFNTDKVMDSIHIKYFSY